MVLLKILTLIILNNGKGLKLLKVHLWNLGKYNESELVGGWIKLPVSEKKLDNFLKQVVGLNGEYEEYMISDYETDLQYSPFEYENIYMLNILATISERIQNIETINCYIDTQANLSITEIINIILQEEKIPYYTYGFEGIENCEYMDKEEKYGYSMAEATGVTDILDKNNIIDYFDFKRYGEVWCSLDSVELYDNGYIDLNEEIDLSFYSEDEIKDIAKEMIAENSNNQNLEEMEWD